ncbi:MAG: hypothetical protein HYY48_08885 [Gammaproteobacteria bacterium]|nr:hypothetical protein [Gammaproteobacteria bacterium]
MKKLLVALLLGLVSAGGYAAEAEGFLKWVDTIHNADMNKDGMVSAHEIMMYNPKEAEVGFRPFMVDHFAAWDADGDGNITMDEIHNGMVKANMTDKDMSRAFFEMTGFQPPRSNK